MSDVRKLVRATSGANTIDKLRNNMPLICVIAAVFVIALILMPVMGASNSAPPNGDGGVTLAANGTNTSAEASVSTDFDLDMDIEYFLVAGLASGQLRADHQMRYVAGKELPLTRMVSISKATKRLLFVCGRTFTQRDAEYRGSWNSYDTRNGNKFSAIYRHTGSDSYNDKFQEVYERRSREWRRRNPLQAWGLNRKKAYADAGQAASVNHNGSITDVAFPNETECEQLNRLTKSGDIDVPSNYREYFVE